jgi:hypothetical protein
MFPDAFATRLSGLLKIRQASLHTEFDEKAEKLSAPSHVLPDRQCSLHVYLRVRLI